MQTTTDRRWTRSLLVTAIGVLAVLLILIAVCRPYFHPETAEQTLPSTEAPTEAPTQAPTEMPTEPPTQPLLDLPLNPYGPQDFQFEGRYLKCKSGSVRTGIDVSAHQQDIDWEQVRSSGIEFAFVRLAYRGYESGKIVMDPYADANILGATQAGLDVGVYFFSQAISEEEAREEAAFVLEAVKPYELTMPIVYDWETVDSENARTHQVDRETLTACTLAFCQAIEEAGYDTMIYFNRHQADTLLDLEQLGSYDFWLAMYSKRMDYPYSVAAWQYTNRGKVPGIEGHTDINILFEDVG